MSWAGQRGEKHYHWLIGKSLYYQYQLLLGDEKWYWLIAPLNECQKNPKSQLAIFYTFVAMIETSDPECMCACRIMKRLDLNSNKE